MPFEIFPSSSMLKLVLVEREKKNDAKLIGSYLVRTILADTFFVPLDIFIIIRERTWKYSVNNHNYI